MSEDNTVLDADSLNKSLDKSLDNGMTMTAAMVLATARKEMGLSQKEVADALFLSLGFIQYIDEDQIDMIPKKAFIKGYLRSYAKLVNLDPDGVVDLYSPGTKKEESPVLMRAIRPDAISKISFTGPVLISSLIGLVCLAVIIFFVWYYASPVEEKRPVVTSVEDSLEDVAIPLADAVVTDAVTESPINESLAVGTIIPALTIPTNEEADLSQEPAEALTASISDPFSEVLPETTDDVSAGPEVTIERSSIGLTNYITVDAGGKDELLVAFADDCWLEVEDSEGNSIYGDLGRGGDELTVNGTAPFKLLVGKPNVVSVLFNGDEVDLAPFITAARTAKLVLGEAPGDTE